MESKIKEFIGTKNRILLVPDPENKLDSLAASFAMALVLEQMNKEVAIYFDKNLPEKLNFLNIQRFIKQNPQDNIWSVIIDTSALPVKKIEPQKESNILKLILHTENTFADRSAISIEGGANKWGGIITLGPGKLLEDSLSKHPFAANTPILNIDTNKGASSISETLTRMLKEGGEKYINEDVATSLLTGIVAATQNFQAPSLKPQSLFSSAYLIAKKARNETIVRHLYKTKSLDSVKLWGSVISNFNFNPDKKIGWTHLSKHEGAQKAHVANLINELKNNFAQAEVFVMGIEKENIKTAIIHSSNPAKLVNFTTKHGIPVKNSSCIVRLNTLHDIKIATEKLAQEIEKTL